MAARGGGERGDPGRGGAQRPRRDPRRGSPAPPRFRRAAKRPRGAIRAGKLATTSFSGSGLIAWTSVRAWTRLCRRARACQFARSHRRRGAGTPTRAMTKKGGKRASQRRSREGSSMRALLGGSHGEGRACGRDGRKGGEKRVVDRRGREKPRGRQASVRNVARRASRPGRSKPGSGKRRATGSEPPVARTRRAGVLSATCDQSGNRRGRSGWKIAANGRGAKGRRERRTGRGRGATKGRAPRGRSAGGPRGHPPRRARARPLLDGHCVEKKKERRGSDTHGARCGDNSSWTLMNVRNYARNRMPRHFTAQGVELARSQESTKKRWRGGLPSRPAPRLRRAMTSRAPRTPRRRGRSPSPSPSPPPPLPPPPP